ncbi:MAG: hypothetical protein C0501_11700 [Isosphaera sp.]|nr:hypothetical protein [Isosphaera sp.]
MRRVATLWAGAVPAALAAAVLLTPTSRAGDIGYVEDFALARDRAAALKQLIPGTEDYYYYHALHYLNTAQFDKIDALAGPWHHRHGQTARLTEVQTRLALLTYDKTPDKTLALLRDRLGLQFNHQKEVVGAVPNLPVVLDPKLIARDTLRAYSLRSWGNLDNFEDSALDGLAATDDLGWATRRTLLSRLTRPDAPDLAKMVVADLNAKDAGEFGYLNIHRQLTLAQLDEVVRLKPNVLNTNGYVNAYLTKLQPGADDDWRRDRAVALAYLERLQAFADRLDPVHNSVKAHALFHRLAFDRAEGKYDRARFLAYLRLPRQMGYVNPRFNERVASSTHFASLSNDYAPFTMLAPVGDDQELVRSYLKEFFSADGATTKDFEPYVLDTWLVRLFAETQIELGRGDPEAWASKLSPEEFRALKDRIDIDFAFTNKTDYAADEAVSLDLHVKNVPNLLVKVFEVNTGAVYKVRPREIDTDVNLDGLVANTERGVRYDDAPFRRVPRRFAFPELNKPGVYVIDFIGGGKSSRALVRKGRLRPLVTTGPAGQTVRVVDEKNRPVNDATVWLGNAEYVADKNGAITVPFTAEPGRRPVVISRGDFASLDFIDHKAETYRLTAGIHVDRESLLSQRVAPVLVRAGLFLNDTPVSLKLLEEVKLRIISVDNSDVPASTEVPEFQLFEDREAVHEVRVPSRLKALTVVLTARVKNASTGKTVDLSAGHAFALNAVDLTDKIEDLHLARFADGYVIELLGRSGEAKPDRAVHLSIKHRDFKQPVTTSLKTDAAGRVHLGQLTDIATVAATGPEGTAHTWRLSTDAHTYRQVVHARAGDPVTLPYVGVVPAASRDELALFEVRGSDIRADKFDALAVKDGRVEIVGLAPGDYDLHLKRTGEKIRVRVVGGVVEAGHVLGNVRHLQVPGLKPVAVESVTADKDSVTVQLRDVSRFTRVHVFATRYQPAFDAFANLARVRDAELTGVAPGHADSVYLTGRNIGDEYRYVLDRKNQKKYAGNMLERPALLLNPWAVRTTETGEQMAQGGDMFRGRGGATGSKDIGSGGGSGPGRGEGWAGGPAGGDFANLDFLADASVVALNVAPDKDGRIKLTRKDVGPHGMVHVVAVDPLGTTSRSAALPEVPAAFADLRLRTGLDPARHFTQQQQVTVVNPKEPFVLADVAGSRFQAYDSLARVYGYYATLSKNPTLAEFGFVLTWPKLKPEEKRALYSKHACHELNFFLSRKDPRFFADVVKPSLANKKDKTFLDHYLLGHDLSGFLKPWEYGRLNTVERVLLARTVPGEGEKTARHLSDLLRLQPPNVERQLFQFNVGLLGDLTNEDGGVVGALARKQSTLKSLEALSADEATRLHTRTAGLDPQAGLGVDFAAKPGSAVPTASPAAPPGMPRPEAGYSRDGRSTGKGKKDGDKGSPDGAVPADDAKGEAKEFFFAEELEKRNDLRRLFRKLDPTQEWAENNYYKLRIQQQVAALVPEAEFWHDYARHDGKSPFLSRHLADASRNFTEMMFALSVLDLPFTPGMHQLTFDGGRMTMIPAGNMIAFHEEVRPAGGPGGMVPILVSENFYRHGDRFREENGERYDKFVTGEYVVHTVYGAQVVVTNPTSSRQKLSVLLQLPVGAIPVLNGQFTRSVPLDLQPYHTQTIDYAFYFPKAGTFPHFPAHVAKNEQFLAAAHATAFEVVDKPTKLDTTSWDHVSQHGTSDEVLAFLNRENVRALNLEKIAFRMKDRAFFEAAVKLLDARHLYHPTTWSYGIFHADVPTARQFLLHADNLVAQCGGPIDSPLLTVDPVARHQYEHLEYKPLVNARAHSLGSRRQIVNEAVLHQYHAFLKTLTYQKEPDDTTLLATVYYLLLQDRVDEAFDAFGRVNPDRVATRMQYDYCAAYLELFKDDPKRARAIATQYLFHPVDRWRNAFAAVVAQIDEIEGKGPKVVDKDERDQAQGGLAATEPGFEFTVNAAGVNLTWQNLDAVKVNYYLMDVELLFSTSPFVQKAGGQFSTIKPNAAETVKLPGGRTKHTVPLPAQFEGRNVLVEVTAAGKTKAVPHLATTMSAGLSENYGQLRVTETADGRAVGKAYVKVYAKLADGSVKFHKDGYTDLRGRFDYASVNTPERQAVEKFAILVLSDDRGALIREVAPPQK